MKQAEYATMTGRAEQGSDAGTRGRVDAEKPPESADAPVTGSDTDPDTDPESGLRRDPGRWVWTAAVGGFGVGAWRNVLAGTSVGQIVTWTIALGPWCVYISRREAA